MGCACASMTRWPSWCKDKGASAAGWGCSATSSSADAFKPQRKLARGNTGGTARISTDNVTGSRLINPGSADHLGQATVMV
jgi:hypothetical protein